jgi:Xaa-Pro aminopeptidase
MDMNKISERRFEALRELMAKNGLNGIMFFENTNEELGAWLEGQRGMGKTIPWYLLGGYILKKSGKLIYVNSDALFTEPAVIQPDPGMPPMPENPWCETVPGFYIGDIKDCVSDGKLGVVNPDGLKKTLSDFIAANLGDIQLVDITEDVYKLKAVKCQDGLEGMAQAAKLHDRLFSALEISIQDGRTEREASVDIRQRLSDFGADAQDINNTIAVSITSAPQGGPSAKDIVFPGRRFQYGDRVNVAASGMMWSQANGFSGAIGRCCTLGKATDETKKYWQLAVEAQDFAAKAIADGAVSTLKQLTEKLNAEFMAPNGLPAVTGNWAFGIGSARWESPMAVGDTADWQLQPGMTIVLAPPVAVPGQDDYCCADMYAIEADGVRPLTGSSRELIEID